MIKEALAANLQNAFEISNTAANAYATTNTSSDLSATIGSVLSLLLGLVGIIFVLLIIVAGIIWLTAAGDEKKVEKSQKMIKASVIGLIIVIGAYAATYFFMNIFQKNK